MVAEIRDRLAISNRAMEKFDMDKFNLKKLKEVRRRQKTVSS
jgi:hypothetical protein